MRTMDQYQAQQDLTQAQQQVWDSKTKEEKKEILEVQYHLKEMMATEGWVWMTKYFKAEYDDIRKSMKFDNEPFKLYRGQGGIMVIDRMRAQMEAILKVRDEEETDGSGN